MNELKAWIVTVRNSNSSGVYYCESAAKARYAAFRLAKEARVNVQFPDLVSRRAKQFDVIFRGATPGTGYSLDHARDLLARELSIGKIRLL